MNVRESTLAAINHYERSTGRWPTRAALYDTLPERVQSKIDDRLSALVRQGLVTVDRYGRIIASVGVASTETT